MILKWKQKWLANNLQIDPNAIRTKIFLLLHPYCLLLEGCAVNLSAKPDLLSHCNITSFTYTGDGLCTIPRTWKAAAFISFLIWRPAVKLNVEQKLNVKWEERTPVFKMRRKIPGLPGMKAVKYLSIQICCLEVSPRLVSISQFDSGASPPKHKQSHPMWWPCPQG